MALLPPWFPTEALLIGLAVVMAAALLMNRGNRWVLNVLAQDEPILVGIGAFLLVGATWLAENVGLEPRWWMAAGAVVALVGIAARYTDRLDVRGLV